MRLEEWQKFIESQFLEDGGVQEREPESPEAIEPTEPGAKPTAGVEIKAESAAAPVARPDFPYAPVTVKPTVDAASHEAKPLFAPPDAADIPKMTLPFAEMETATAPAPPVAETPEPSYRQTLDFDADIPDFASYMPSARSDASQAAPSPAFEAKTERRAAAPDIDASETDAAGSDAAVRIARNPRTRARHARNVRPENVASGLSAAEMWADVPRHVQTLLALERIEEKEIAQSSYKRPFAEGRLELIERLLDPILSLEDTARLLNVCPTTVRRYTNRGILTHYRKEPERNGDLVRPTERETRQRRFRLSDILAFLETQQTALNADRESERASRRSADAAGKAAPTAV